MRERREARRRPLLGDDDPSDFNDKQSITGDPTHAGYAYATWLRGALPGENRSFISMQHSYAYRGQPMFSRTTDGGQTWSTPKPMTNQSIYAQGNQIVVLPDGTLVDVFAALFKGAGYSRMITRFSWPSSAPRTADCTGRRR
jgi:hypothetical protein